MISSPGLGEAYDATIRRIKAQEGDRARLGMAALMWISHSLRPLEGGEICHALAVEIGSTEINPNDMSQIQTVLSCCRGLATIDEKSSTVRLVHFTLKEYLSDHTALFNNPHSTIAETCLTYLNYQTIKGISASRSRDLGDGSSPRSAYRRADMRTELLGRPSLLEYSSLYWGTHMRMEPSDRSRYLALDLLSEYDSHISAQLLPMSTVEWWYDVALKPFSALRCISHFDIVEVVIDLVRTKGWDVNQRDRDGLTLLMWAARHGREEVVRFLLQQKHTQPDMADTEYGLTALSWAAMSGHEGVVGLFLGPLFVNPGGIGRWLGAVQAMSLPSDTKYVNPNRPDKGGQTPLSWAARNRHDGVVKLLLERGDVKPNRPDRGGRTPLWWAASIGHDGAVKLLLDREDISPDIQDYHKRTPLEWSASCGHDRVVKLLLGREDVRPDRPNSSGETPLLWAASNGHDGVVKLLLEREGINPDRPDRSGRTPLWWAATSGYDRVVELLLGRQDVSPDRPDNGRQTPFSRAARGGYHGVVKLLLARGGVNPDRLEEHDRTPLSWAAGSGHDRVVKLLLEREDVNPDRLDYYRRTPLSWAACGGHDRVVKLLLALENVNPDRPDNCGRTPLSWAAENGRDGVVELLLGREDVSPDMPDNRGSTPVSWAAQNRRDRVVKLLSERGGVRPGRPTNVVQHGSRRPPEYRRNISVFR